jgi:methionine-rich copper-binding protein CopC
MNAVHRAMVGALVVLLVAIAAPQVASAHARYKRSTPGTGEVVQASPTQVDLTFTQDVQKVSGSYGMTVTNGQNAVVSTASAVINDQDRSKMSVQLAPNLPPGRYVVTWNNVSDADGHDETGAFSFYVGVQPSAADIVADNELAKVGADELTPTGSATATAGAVETPAPTSTGPVTGPASPSAAPTASSSSGGSSGGGNTGLLLGLGIAAAVILVAGGGAWWYRSGRQG